MNTYKKSCFLWIVLIVTTNACAQKNADKNLLSIANLDPINVKIEDVQFKGKKAIRVTGTEPGEQLAIIKDLELQNGVISIDIAGQPLPGSDPSARGFIGIAFRVRQGDSLKYECFYLRPTNARSESQLRRNHSTQYISYPDFPWEKLRKENPGEYESYVDIVPGEWTSIMIIVKGKSANLYVNGDTQPCLIVPNLKGAIVSGSIALWIGPGTDGHFRDLKVNTPN